MKKVLILIIAGLFLVGCGCMDDKASDAVKSYLDQYRNLNDNVIGDLEELVDKQTLSEDQKKVYKTIMEKQYKDLKYEIVKEDYDGDTAKVTAKITVYDLYKVQEDADSYMGKHMEEFYDENKTYDNTKYLDYKLKKMKENTETVSYTIVFDVKKTDKKWIVEQPSQEDLEKIHGIHNYELD